MLKRFKSQGGHLRNTIITIVIIAIIAIGGMAILAKLEPKEAKIGTSTTIIKRSRKILTVEQAETYIGKTLKELCAEFGDYENIHPYEFSERGGGGGVPCSEVGNGYWYDDFIVVQAYYYYDEQSEAKYNENQEACRKKDQHCNDAPSVYVDTVPEIEVRAAGIVVK